MLLFLSMFPRVLSESVGFLSVSLWSPVVKAFEIRGPRSKVRGPPLLTRKSLLMTSSYPPPTPLSVAPSRSLSYDVLRKPVPAFGDKFRKAREAKKLSLDDVSRVTKIGTRMLQAIEEEHFDLLPGGVFNKGFIRAYAKHLGLSDEEAVTDYLACLRQAQIDANQFREPAPARTSTPPKTAPVATPKPTPPKPAPKSHTAVDEVELPDLQLPRPEAVRRPPRSYPAQRESFPWIPALLVLIVILAVALFWTRRSRAAHHQPEAASAIPPITHPASTTNVPSPAPAPANNSSAPSAPKPIPTSSSAENKDNKSQIAKADVARPDALPPAAHSSSLTTSPDARQPAVNNSATSDVTIRTPAKAAPAAKPAASMTLVIRASENTWISVLADGQLVSQETLIAPANTTVHATREISVRVGNAAGVSFLWNNQEIPAQGAESEVKSLVFDQSGLRIANPPAQNP